MSKIPLHKKYELLDKEKIWEQKQKDNPIKPDSYGFYDMQEGWKDFLNEDMVSVDELPDDIKFEVKFTPKDSGMIIMANKYGQPLDHKKGDPLYGQMWLSWYPECGGYMIQWVKASKGYGPLLYDLALEMAAKHDSWIVSDRTAVSPEAEKVWEYYDQHRNDVEKEPIGLDKDCSFKAAIKAVKYHMADAESRGIKPIYTDWEHHPMAYKWRKPQAETLMALKNRGMLYQGPIREKIQEEMLAKYDKKYKQVYFEIPLSEDEFIHFTTARRAQEIIQSNKLMMRPPYDKFGIDAVSAVSLTYGQNVPGVQTTHLPDDEGQILAVKFKTNTLPDIGFVEEVNWHEDVIFTEATIITKQKAMALLEDTPENKRLNKYDWGFVKYIRE